MTTIIVTFICDINKNLRDEKKEKGKKGKGEKGNQKKKGEKGNKKKKGKKVVKIVDEKKKNGKGTEKEEIKDEKKEKEKEDELEVVTNVKKPIKYIHIEYNLLPGKLMYKIDVVFWGTIAKVYTKDGMKAMKSININGHCWIAFSIKHKVLLEENDLVKLKSHAANFSITTAKKKIGSSVAKKDAEKTFYFHEQDITLKSQFAEAFESAPNVEETEELDLKMQTVNDIKYILNDLLDFPTKSEPRTDLLIIPEELHEKKTLKIIDKVNSNIVIKCLNSLEEPQNVNELLATKKKGKGGNKSKSAKSNKKKDKKGKNKGKKKKNDTSQVIIPGESYFTNPNMTLFDLKLKNDDLSHNFACIDVRHLMNADQKHKLNPMIIKVDKIINVPNEILKRHGFSLIYVSYNICNINYKTGARPISNVIHFNDHHIYFIERDDLEEFSECIQNGFLLFQIHGIRIIPVEKRSEMFGQNVKDEFISKPIQNEQHEVLEYTEGEIEYTKKSILLAIARVTLTDLLKPFWRILRNEFCTHPRNIRNLDENCDKFTKITTNEINIEFANTFDQNPLTENILLSSGFTIKIGAQLLNPIVNVLDNMIDTGNSYNRILLIFIQPNIARSFLFNIFVHNAHWLKRKNIIPNYLIKYEDIPDEKYEKNIITGFSIGCGDHCIMFLEGNRELIYQLFWSAVRRERKHDVKVIYNSNYVHDKRLYSSLIPYGGVYFITLQYPLITLLNCVKTYSKGYMPEPCRRVLLKLDLIRKTNFLYELPENLLPTAKELLSLGLEWGVPLHWPL